MTKKYFKNPEHSTWDPECPRGWNPQDIKKAPKSLIGVPWDLVDSQEFYPEDEQDTDPTLTKLPEHEKLVDSEWDE